MNLFSFYAIRGYKLNELAGLSYVEKVFLRHAQIQFYNEENKKLTGGGDS